MNENDLLARLHTMYERRLPVASGVWDWLHAVEFIAFARSPLMEAVQRLRAQGVVPTCKWIEVLPNHHYRIILTRVQLERVIAEHYGGKT